MRRTPGPLEVLYGDLRDAGRPTLAWATEHAPAGHFERLWQRERTPGILVRLAALEHERRALVAAVCACVRPALQSVPRGEERPRRVLDVVEAWTNERASDEAVARADDVAVAALATLRAAVGVADDHARAAVGAVRNAALGAVERDAYLAGEALGAAVELAAYAGVHLSPERALAEVAAQLKGALRCPSLVALLEAAAARRARSR